VVGEPPAAKAETELCVEGANLVFAVAKSFTSVKLEPFQDSVFACDPPPKAMAPEATPDPLNPDLAVFKSPTSVHEDPSQDSLFATSDGVYPPKYKPEELEEPAAPPSALDVFNSAISVQEDPFQDSIDVDIGGTNPPHKTEDV